MYALNVYNNSYNRKRKFHEPLQQWLIDLAARKPHAIFLIGGDFNSKEQPIQHFQSLLEPAVPTFRRTIRHRIVQSRTDWLLCSQQDGVEHTTETQWTQHSDHCIIFSVLEIPNRRPEATHIRLPNAPIALSLCQVAELNSETTDDFLTLHHRLAAKQWHMRRIRLSLRQKQKQKIPDLAGFAQLIDEHLRTAQSKTAFQLINSLSIVHPTKRDGGIMQCYLAAPDDRLVFGQEAVLLNCLEQL